MIEKTKLDDLSDEEFIDFCYEQILDREADDHGKAVYRHALEQDLITRAETLATFLKSEEYQSKKTAREFVPAGHFYSVVPSTETREAFIKQSNTSIKSLPGININPVEQATLLASFQQYYDECPFQEQKQDGARYYFENPAYAHTDAIILHCMMRHFRPEKLIEVGSGFSSCAMLDTNDRFFDRQIDFTFIEPYPELLYSLMNDDDEHFVIGEAVQNVDLELFSRLRENDILFIDSTHVAKLGSDVNHLIFNVLPSLNSGVLIHVHDIFWPFEYPSQWVQEGRAWNEAYLLRAFLQHNDEFEIIFFSHFMHLNHEEWIKRHMPKLGRNWGGNIWLRKK